MQFDDVGRFRVSKDERKYEPDPRVSLFDRPVPRRWALKSVQRVGGLSIDHVQKFSFHVLSDFCGHPVDLVKVSHPAGAIRSLPVDHNLPMDFSHLAEEAILCPLAQVERRDVVVLTWITQLIPQRINAV